MADDKTMKGISPAKPVKWVALNKPDTRFDKDGKYRVYLVFDQDDEFVKEVEAFAVDAYEEMKAGMKPAQAKKFSYNSPVIDEEDAEGELTGNVLIQFFTNATYKDRTTKEQKPVILKGFDTNGERIKKLPNIGSGSVLRIQYSGKVNVVGSNYYFNFYLNAFQLLELKEFGGPGFDKVEGGYTAPQDDSFGADTGGEEPASSDEF